MYGTRDDVLSPGPYAHLPRALYRLSAASGAGIIAGDNDNDDDEYEDEHDDNIVICSLVIEVDYGGKSNAMSTSMSFSRTVILNTSGAVIQIQRHRNARRAFLVTSMLY